MASTSATYPTSMASTKLAGENNTWADPTNVGSDNAAYASITATTFDNPDLSYALVCLTFGFAIPNGATIDGVVAEVERYYANGTVSDYDIQLRYNGTALGDVKTSGTNWGAYPSSVGIVTCGGATDKWGATLTEAIIEHATFGVAYHCQAKGTNSDAYVDYVRMTIYYTSAVDIIISLAAVMEATGAATEPPLVLISNPTILLTSVIQVSGTLIEPTIVLVSNPTIILTTIGEATGTVIEPSLLIGMDILLTEVMAAIGNTTESALIIISNPTIGLTEVMDGSAANPTPVSLLEAIMTEILAALGSTQNPVGQVQADLTERMQASGGFNAPVSDLLTTVPYAMTAEGAGVEPVLSLSVILNLIDVMLATGEFREPTLTIGGGTSDITILLTEIMMALATFREPSLIIGGGITDTSGKLNISTGVKLFLNMSISNRLTSSISMAKSQSVLINSKET